VSSRHLLPINYRSANSKDNPCLMKNLDRSHRQRDVHFINSYISYHFGSIFSRDEKGNNRRDEKYCTGMSFAARSSYQYSTFRPFLKALTLANSSKQGPDSTL